MSGNNKNRICTVTNCKSCNGYNLQYRYVNVHLNEKSLQTTLELIYEYDTCDNKYKESNPFGIKFGLAFISILTEDFQEFKKAVEEVVLEQLVVPQIKYQ